LLSSLRLKITQAGADRRTVEDLLIEALIEEAFMGRNRMAALAYIFDKLEGRPRQGVDVKNITEELRTRNDDELRHFLAHGAWPESRDGQAPRTNQTARRASRRERNNHRGDAGPSHSQLCVLRLEPLRQQRGAYAQRHCNATQALAFRSPLANRAHVQAGSGSSDMLAPRPDASHARLGALRQANALLLGDSGRDADDRGTENSERVDVLRLQQARTRAADS
jgi:hypothetical protein